MTSSLQQAIDSGLVQEAISLDQLRMDYLRDRLQGFAGMSADRNALGSMCVIDDGMLQLGPEIAELYSIFSSKFDVVMVTLIQKTFYSSEHLRVIHINAHFLVLFKNVRSGVSDVTNLARQAALTRPEHLIQTYLRVTKRPYSYIIFAFAQDYPDCLRLTSSIFPPEFPMRAYLEAR